MERALGVLRAMAAADDDLGVTDVAARSGLTVSTAHRLLQALRNDGLVAQDPRTERYHLGPTLIALGRRAEARMPFDHLLPHLQQLAAETGESVSLGTRVGDEVLIVLHVDSPHPLRFDQQPGTFVPVHASGMGKALLAFAPDPPAEVAALADLGTFTAATLTSREALLADLERTAARGWALNDGERHGGVRTMAAALRDRTGRVWAAVAIQGPTARLDDDRLAELAPLLLDAVAAMERTGA